MKLNRIILPAIIAASLCSCSDDPKEDPENDWIVYFNDITAFNQNNYWQFCYDMEYQNTLTFYNFTAAVNFSHSCEITEFGGVKYYSWRGFTPSRATDTKDYSAEGTWIEHQWTAVPGKGMQGQANYMIAFCNANETADDATTSTSTVITPVTDGEFAPKRVYLTNTTYGMYSMKNGSAFNSAFTDQDWCKVTISGVKDNAVTGAVDFYLAKDGEFVTRWTEVDLTSIGKCERLVFTMESSDSGQWGMNNASYFALGAFIWGY